MTVVFAWENAQTRTETYRAVLQVWNLCLERRDANPSTQLSDDVTNRFVDAILQRYHGQY